MYQEKVQRNPCDPFFLFYKPAHRTPGDPFGLLPRVPRWYWEDVEEEAVIIVLATRHQLSQFRNSQDKTIYLDGSFKRSKYPLRLINLAIFDVRDRQQVIASALISRETIDNVTFVASLVRHGVQYLPLTLTVTN
eukprot:gb/GECG01006525.1/.p1 GENE.gb/GECG01006525.1/~~gb/GECG01006525.1/.p1  ORF type:complete len:135 (+),score=8.75 gb/GECG01006525.1/:1-405(+)